jgi:hypothetical protein
MTRLLALVGIVSLIAYATDSPQLCRALLTILALMVVHVLLKVAGVIDWLGPGRAGVL